MRFRDFSIDALRLRPLKSLFWQTLGGTLAFLLPLSAVLYFLTVPDGPWPLVLVLQSAIVATFLASYVSYRNLGFWVSTRGIAERGFFGGTKHYRVDEIDTIVLVHTFNGINTDALPQLFLCDTDGKQLLRMRGQFWSLESMETVGDTLDIPLTSITDEVSKAELLASYPGLLYWFERHALKAGIIAGVGLLVAAAAVWGIYLLASGS
jgi:uncharacterized membrane protein